jgi:hypothetical protein
MGEKMTLQQIRDGLILDSKYFMTEGGKPMVQARQMKIYADAIDAYLATPAQTVDVEAVREVSKQLKCTDETGLAAEPCYQLGDKLSQAIGDKT